MSNNLNHILLLALIGASLLACKKLIQVPPPVGSITSAQAFSTDAQATAAVSGIFFTMINSPSSYSASEMTICAGMSADELIPFNQNVNQGYIQFRNNILPSSSAKVLNNFWAKSYSAIYAANASIEGLNKYSGVHDSVKNELLGEVKFARAFSNFYLVNLFGDIPLVTETNWRQTNTLSRTSVDSVYKAIIYDLIDAQQRLPADFSVGNGQRIVPNKWAATALLARVYLYTGDWDRAITQSSSIINNTSLFRLVPDLNEVFLTNSTEAIWQLQQNNVGAPFNATPEGAKFLPTNTSPSFPPFAYLTPQLLNSFESDDNRKGSWTTSKIYNGKQYFIPYKYKVGLGQASATGPYTEYYMVFRLAEQYLIRSEAEAMLDKLTESVADLDSVRNRAGLPNSTALTKADILTSIYHERQIEFMCEWGHRWLDLKRTGQATNALSMIKPTWTESDELYPIPISELRTDPNLTQNKGY